jgi:hypothetical protein
MGFLKQVSLRWSPTFRQQIFCWSSRFAIQVSEYFPDHYRIFDTDNDHDVTATFATFIGLLERPQLAVSSPSPG